MKHSTALDPLAENAVIAVCALADAAGPGQWSSGAVEDAATALEVLAGALSEISAEAAELLEVIPAAVAALRERVEHPPAAAVPARRADAAADPAVLSTGLRRALTSHGLTGHRVHQLGPALLTVTLDGAHAQALAVLLAAHRALPHQPPALEDEPRWGAGPTEAETAAAALAVALAAYGLGTYARVLASGQVTAGFSPTAAVQVTEALSTRPARSAPSSRPRRRGLGSGWKGIDAGR
ncbi:hypothetical protein ACFV2B_07500 [Streptomyces lavendulae]|uniref:hypothetical protein n=1 Tax=Streptomyces lavendulae TaxID=1914 RepID=UPI0036C548B1